MDFNKEEDNMLEQIKKNWFVAIVAVILIFATIFYAKDQTKNNVKSKTVDGKQVVFSIAGENYFAEDYQAAADKQAGDSALYQIFERELLRNMETSDDIKSDAKLRAQNQLTYTKQSAGQAGVDQLNAQLIALGYEGVDSLGEYYENLLKYQELVTNYFIDNYDRLFKKYVDESKPRLVSHILVKMADPKNPTDAEKEKIKKIDEALDKKTSFGDVAALYSDDSSKDQGGNVGVVDKDTSFVKEFKEAALKLNKGEMSTWITTDYGQHLILIEETDFKKLLNDTDFFQDMTTKHTDEISGIMWKQAEDLGIEFLKDGVEDRLKEILGLTEDKK